MSGLSSESAAQPPRAPLSAIVIARNEEARLRECLASVAFASEIIVVDSGSTDATVAIARSMGARVEITHDWPGFGAQKNRALALATQPWVFSIDADERVSPRLRDSILRVVQGGGDADAYAVPRRSSYCGQFMAHSGWYPDWVTRLVRRGTARFSDDRVHERLLTNQPPARLQGDLLHLTYPDLETMLAKLNAYSTAGAQGLHDRGRRASVSGAVLHGLWAFVRTYVFKRGFLDGRMGFVLAVSTAENSYYRHLKLWLLQSSQTVDNAQPASDRLH